MRHDGCIRCVRSIGWIGLVGSAVLMVMKAFVGLVAGSQAMIADAMYSAKDVVSSLLVIVGMAMSEKSLDRKHPYGHGKVEFILSMFVSVIFMVVTGFLMFHALATLLDDEVHRAPHLIALWTALLAVAVNMTMYFYSKCVFIETNSPLVRTLAKHHHADAAASGAVAAGIVGAHYMNMPWLDTVVAALETMHLMYLGGDVFRDAVRGLMDRTIEVPHRSRIMELVENVKGVEKVKSLRTRYVGQDIFAEIVIGVGSGLSVYQACAIGDAVKENLARTIPGIGSIKIINQAVGVEDG